MLTKLMKYENRAVARFMLPVYIGVTALAFGSALLGCLYRSSALENSAPFLIFTAAFEMVTVFGLVALILSCVFFCAQRFFRLLGDEGYVMFALPVKPWQQLAARLLPAIAWTALTAVVTVLLIFMMTVTGTGTSYGQSFLPGATAWEKALGFAILAVTAALGLAFGYLMLYLCMAIGAQWPQHRLFASVVSYFVLSALLQFAATALMILTVLLPSPDRIYNWVTSLSLWLTKLAETDPFQMTCVLLGAGSLILLVMNGMLWAATQYLITKRLNLA